MAIIAMTTRSSIKVNAVFVRLINKIVEGRGEIGWPGAWELLRMIMPESATYEHLIKTKKSRYDLLVNRDFFALFVEFYNNAN